jgi:hypothetical protein
MAARRGVQARGLVVVLGLERGDALFEIVEHDPDDLERLVHDETLQGFGALRLALSAAHRVDDSPPWRTAIADAIAQLDVEIANVRGIIADVRPAPWTSSGSPRRSRRWPTACAPAGSTSP